VPIERVRRFEGPVLAERAYRAEEAQRATLRQPGDSGPGRSLADLVSEGLRAFGVDPADAEWDSRKRPDGGWQVQLSFNSGSRPHLAEWIYDPHRRHVAPADDTAMRLCQPDAELPEPVPGPRSAPRATVTPIGSRLAPGSDGEQGRPAERARVPARPAQEQQEAAPAVTRDRPARKAAGGRSRRSSVPSWDEIMFGTSRPSD